MFFEKNITLTVNKIILDEEGVISIFSYLEVNTAKKMPRGVRFKEITMLAIIDIYKNMAE